MDVQDLAIFGNTGGSVEFSPGGVIQCLQVRIGGGDCLYNGSADPYAIAAAALAPSASARRQACQTVARG